MEIAKQLPNDYLIEQTILGSILIGHTKKEELLAALKPDDFFDTRHVKIARYMLDMWAEGKIVDTIGIYDELERNKESDGGVGWIAYISSLTDGLARKGGNVMQALKMLRRKSHFRKLANLTNNLHQLAMSESGEPEALYDAASQHFSEIFADCRLDDDGLMTYQTASIEALKQAKEGSRLNIKTGIAPLDEMTGGFREGELVVVTAETGTGKSLLAAQIRTLACDSGHHALFCSGEMTAPHLATRELASVTSIGPYKMRHEWLLTPDDHETLREASESQCDKCQILAEDLRLAKIRSVARKIHAKQGLDLLILDYDELIEADTGTANKTEFEQQRVIARAAKGMAMELKCVVILISQLRKSHQGEDSKNPSLDRLYGSGAKKKYANFIILADRPFVRELKGDEKEAELRIMKGRDGQTGRVPAVFNLKTLRFEQGHEEINWRN